MYQRNRMYNFLSFPAFSIGVAKHKILLAKSYILFFGRIVFLKKRDRKNKINNLMAEYNILKLYDSASRRIQQKKCKMYSIKNVWFGQNLWPNRTDTKSDFKFSKSLARLTWSLMAATQYLKKFLLLNYSLDFQRNPANDRR